MASLLKQQPFQKEVIATQAPPEYPDDVKQNDSPPSPSIAQRAYANGQALDELLAARLRGMTVHAVCDFTVAETQATKARGPP